MKHILFFLLALSLAPVTFAQQSFSAKQIHNDLEYLRSSLEATHYDLYAFTPKEAFEANFKAVKASGRADTYSLSAATTLFQQVISIANTGHAEIDFPITSYIEYAYGGGTLFPLELAIEKGTPVISVSHAKDERLAIGSEILAINGTPISNILADIGRQLSAETTYFKAAKMELWTFPRLYWQLHGKIDSFEITLATTDGPVTVTVPAILAIDEFETVRDDPLSGDRKFELHGKTAYIKPGDFSGDESEYRSFIAQSFDALRSASSERLIIDLRNNKGGDDAFSDYLVSFFADRPFRWSSEFRLRTSDLLKEDTRAKNLTNPYFEAILSHESGETYAFDFGDYEPQAETLRYQGEVLVLINRQSHSMAAVTAAMVQDYGFGTVMGEETGDHPTLHASQFQYVLPETGITVKVPKGYMIRPNGSEERVGVQPDIPVMVSVTDTDDRILKAALELTAHGNE